SQEVFLHWWRRVRFVPRGESERAMTADAAGDSSVVRMFFAHNTWANVKLLEFCEKLSEEQLTAAVVGGYGSIGDTLKHILNSEVSYGERVNGKLPEKPLSIAHFPSFEVLKAAARWAGEELLALA